MRATRYMFESTGNAPYSFGSSSSSNGFVISMRIPAIVIAQSEAS
jgi:hypothetical protein